MITHPVTQFVLAVAGAAVLQHLRREWTTPGPDGSYLRQGRTRRQRAKLGDALFVAAGLIPSRGRRR